MKSGRQRSNEAEMPYQDAVDAGAMSTASMAQNVIQDIKSKIEQLSQQANSIRDEIKRTKSAQAAIPTGAQQIKVTPTGNWTARDQQGRGMAGGAVGLPPQKSKKS
jgi:outer membrane murein-binding lipoprotein Lpp